MSALALARGNDAPATAGGSLTRQVLRGGLAACLLVTILATVFVLALRSRQRSILAAQRTVGTQLTLAAAERDVIDLETGLRGYLATGQRLFLAPERAASAQLPRQLEKLTRLVNRENRFAARELDQAGRAYLTAYVEPAVRAPHPPRGRRLLPYVLHGKHLVDALRARFARLSAAEGVSAARWDRRGQHALTLVYILVGLSAALMAGCLGACTWFVWSRIALPLRRSGAALDVLAGGDHSIRLPLEGAGEALAVARAFNMAAARLEAGERSRHAVEERLRFLADHDPLTALLNRRKFSAELERHVAHIGRYGAEGAVVVLDLDHFKQVNDTLGHPAGDEVLLAAAEVLRDSLRQTDSVGRLGGDEFAVLLTRATRADAEAVAAKLVTALRERLAAANGGGPAVTASVGVAMFARDAGDRRGLSADAILAEADFALYDAKQSGRNRYAVFATAADLIAADGA
jgi:diguanylate cyclase (GGDEF)-like protein